MAALTVGTRVRVVADGVHHGLHGVIVEDAGDEHSHPLTVEFDACSHSDAFFRADELAPA